MAGLMYPDLLKGLELLFVYERDWVPHRHHHRGRHRDEALRVLCARLGQGYSAQECHEGCEDGYDRAQAEVDNEISSHFATNYFEHIRKHITWASKWSPSTSLCLHINDTFYS